MTKELELKLQEKYPKIFADLYGDPRNTCMHWGLCCGDGWYDLIDRLCASLQWHADKNGYRQVVAEQVKEKFGTLRFYHRFEDTEDSIKCRFPREDAYLEGHISFAESISGSICETCGKPGKATKGGWITVICNECKTKLKGENDDTEK